MQANPLAVIDLGTNTFHLLVAQPASPSGFTILYEEKFVAKIGKGGISKGILTEEAYNRALQGLYHFRRQMDIFKLPSERIFAIATSAIRNATNGLRLIEDIYQQTGIEVKIISGDKEAELIYYGVRASMDIGQQPSLIVDIGGGSVEFIVCTSAGILWKHSFEIGAQRLLDKFMYCDPIPMYAIQKLHEYLQQALIPLTNAIHQYAPQVLIGASGAFDTLVDIHYHKDKGEIPKNVTEFQLPVGVFYEIYEELLTRTREERLAIPGMLEMRVDMIVVASCLINFLVHTYTLAGIRVSTYALKEGLLSTKLANQEL